MINFLGPTLKQLVPASRSITPCETEPRACHSRSLAHFDWVFYIGVAVIVAVVIIHGID
jgi:hypothetical protein